METRIEFNPNETDFKRRMAIGHEMRNGHPLTGYYVEVERGIFNLVRTCDCA